MGDISRPFSRFLQFSPLRVRPNFDTISELVQFEVRYRSGAGFQAIRLEPQKPRKTGRTDFQQQESKGRKNDE